MSLHLSYLPDAPATVTQWAIKETSGRLKEVGKPSSEALSRYPGRFYSRTVTVGAWGAVPAPAPSTPNNLHGHVLYVCPNNCEGCMFCDGGLSTCTRCGAFEGCWPDHCPGERMTEEQSDAVYAGELNYRDLGWQLGECCQVMRPTHRRAEFLAEHAKDAPNA